jgi:hypothetical protein
MATNLWNVAMVQAMQTRLSGDTTPTDGLTVLLGTNAAGNIRTTYAQPATDPEGTTYPLVQMWPMSDQVDDSFNGRRLECLFNVRASVAKTSGTSGYDPVLMLMRIHERIVGDWPDQSSRVPSYGLDRWQADLTVGTGFGATTYAAEMMVYMGYNGVFDDEDSIMRWDMTFKVGLNKQRP